MVFWPILMIYLLIGLLVGIIANNDDRNIVVRTAVFGINVLGWPFVMVFRVYRKVVLSR